MKIAVTVNFSPWSPYSGGGQRSAHNLATALAQLGHDVTAIYTRGFAERVQAPAVAYAIRWATMPTRRSRVDAPLRPLSAISIADHVARLRPQLVHANGEEAALLGPLKKLLGFRLVVTPRYPSFPAAFGRMPQPAIGESLRRWRDHTKYMMLGQTLRAADRWCPTSHHPGHAVGRAFGLPADNRTVVHNGVDEAFLRVDPHAHPRRGLLFFGRLTRQKGVLDLAEALALLGDDAPPCCFVGRGPMSRALRGRLQRAGLAERCTFVDWLSPAALAERLAQTRIAVLPSWEESFGNAIAESMCTGTPLITTDVGSIPELADHGRTAVLVPARAPRAVATAIGELWNDPHRAARLGREARASARSRFGWIQTAKQFTAIYDSL